MWSPIKVIAVRLIHEILAAFGLHFFAPGETAQPMIV
jgi:hypothetical protein